MSSDPCAVEGVDIACTLDAVDLPTRLRAWAGVLDRATARTQLDDGGLRVALPDDVDPAALAALVAAEQRCCAFFAFAITVDGRGLALEVRAPAEAAALVAELFGAADVLA
jgi:MerR family copper efflux transcriptional regulator